MAHEFESGAFARQAAWHGHGTVVAGAMTTAESFEKSGLDWPGGVEKRALWTSAQHVDPNAAPASVLRRSLLPVREDSAPSAADFITERQDVLPRPIIVPNQHAVVRVMDNSILGVVGDQYQVVQNVEMFNFLDALTTGEGKVARWESAGSLRGGRQVWALLNLPDSEITVGRGDKLLPYLLVTNAHDGSAACRVIPTTVRVVCMNTLQAAVAGTFKDLTVTIRHSGDIQGKIAQAQLMLAQAGEMFTALGRLAAELDSRIVGKDTYEQVLEELFPTPEEDAAPATRTRVLNNRLLLAQAVREEVKLLPSPDMTAWTLLNGVTRYVDHAQKVQLRNREAPEARFEHSMIGRGAELKNRAVASIRTHTEGSLPKEYDVPRDPEARPDLTEAHLN